MNVTFLNHFYQVARHGSFSKAARVMRMGQPNLSRSLKLLEVELGESLLIRSRNGISLTKSGQNLFQKAGVIFSGIEDLIREYETPDKPKLLRMAASENLCLHVLPLFLKELLEKKYYTGFDLLSGTAEQTETRVLEGQADIGICFNRPHSATIKLRTLGRSSFVLVGPKGLSLSGIRKLPFIGSRQSDYVKPYFAKSSLKSLGIEPTQIFECNSQEAQLKMVEAGIGFSFVPEFLANLYRGRISIFPDMKTMAPTYLISVKPVDAKLIDILKANMVRGKVFL